MKMITMIEINKDISLKDSLIELQLASTGREQREFIKNDVIQVNGVIVNDIDHVINYVSGTQTVIRRGKRKYGLIAHW